MMLSHYSRSLLSIVLLLCLGLSDAWAQRMHLLQPREYVSPSGAYRLHVDPSERYGRGKARYRLTHQGAEVWAGEKPFTLWEAGVDDRGVVGGYAYSGGKSSGREPSDFRVVILDRQGSVRLEQITKREHSRFIHMDDNPLAAGLLFDPANDRMIVRVEDPDVNRGMENWWVCRLSTAKPAGTVEPRDLTPVIGDRLFILSAELVPGTPLILVHWWAHRSENGVSEVGAVFTLIDTTGKPVWILELPGDYMQPEDKKAEEKLQDEMRQRGGILEVKPTSEFTIRLGAENKRVSYAVHRGADLKWSIKETGRQRYVALDVASKQQAALPRLNLNYAGAVTFKSARQKPAGPIRDIRDFIVDGKGQLAFLRNEQNTDGLTFVLVEPTGKIVREIPIKVGRRDKDDWPSTHLVWVGGDRFLHTQSASGLDAVASDWWIDAGTGQVTAVNGFKCPAIEKIAGFPDGRFVALATLRSKYTLTTTAYLFDAEGKLVHTFRQGYEGGPSSLFSPQDIAVTTDGNILVLDVIRANVAVFAGNGDYRQTVDLAKAWKRKPNYPSYLAADADGGFIVGDFGGSPPVIRMKADGSVLKQFTARFPDGRTADSLQKPKVDPQGRLWADDRNVIVRLGKDGVIEHVLGNPPEAEHLGKVATVKIDSRGRIYAVDARSSAVHVFDPAGQPLYVCNPDPADFKSSSILHELSVADTGDVYLTSFERPGLFLHFSSDGKRLGFESLSEGDSGYASMGQKLLPRCNGAGFWIVDTDSIRLVNEKKQVSKLIERSPKGFWLQRILRGSLASDGSLALLELNSLDGASLDVIHRYDANGKSLQTIRFTLPGEYLCDMDYNGETIVISRRNHILLMTATGRVLGLVDTPQTQRKDVSWTPFLVAKQLWLFDGVDTVHRYLLP